jgi:PST family polysaccharide transporter
LSANFLIGSLSTQSGALLVREMRFGRQAVATISGALVSLSVAVALALHGYRYWSLVWSQLASGLVSTSLMFVLSPFLPGLPSRGTGLRKMLKFGAHITAFDLVNYFHRNLDNILIGRYWGAGPLGLYSRAYALLMFPIANLRGPINAVGFPAMSRLQNQPADYRNYYHRVTSMLALASMPFTAFLFLAAEPIIKIALGSQWTGIIPVFGILAIVAFVQPVITLWGMVLMSRGMGRRYLSIGIFNMACSAAGFLAGIHWGPVGVATGYAVATYLTAYPVLAWSFRGTPLCFQDFLSSVWRPLMASVISILICFLASAWLGAGNALIQIIKDAGLFVPSYFVLFRVLPGGKDELRQFVQLLLPLLPRLRPSKRMFVYL